MRTIIFWLHLSAGVIAGIVIFIMSVTGVLLMYEKQMISWFDQKSIPAQQSGTALSVESLLAQVRFTRGALPASIALPSDPAAPAQLTYGRDNLYQDRTNGRILGAGDPGVRQFFRSVTDWHRWLAAGTATRPTARAVTGAANLIFLFIVLTGSYLWLPRVWTAASLRAITLFRGKLSGKARDFNWHNVIGIWCFLPLVLIVASGAVISYPWASNLVYTLSGSPVPAPPPSREAPPAAAPGRQRVEAGGKREDGPPRSGDRPAAAAVDLAGLDENWRRTADQFPGWRLMTMRLPASNEAPVVFVVDRGYAGQPQKRTTLTIDRKSGAIKSTEAYSDLNQGRRTRTWLRFVHTGEFYGLPGQTIAGIASAGAAVLTYTGISLSLRRLSAWRGRRKRTRQPEPAAQSV